MPSKFVIEGIQELNAMAKDYAGAKAKIKNLILRASNKFALQAQQTSKDKYLSGDSNDVLHVRSGRLRSSITPKVAEQGDFVAISMGSGVPYAAIHEFGGPILRAGKVVGKMPKRSFIGRAFDDTIGPFGEDITTLIMGAAAAGFKNG